MRFRWLGVKGAMFPEGGAATPATTDMLSPIPMTVADPAPAAPESVVLGTQLCIRATLLSKLLQELRRVSKVRMQNRINQLT